MAMRLQRILYHYVKGKEERDNISIILVYPKLKGFVKTLLERIMSFGKRR